MRLHGFAPKDIEEIVCDGSGDQGFGWPTLLKSNAYFNKIDAFLAGITTGAGAKRPSKSSKNKP
jgi:hypothetical protein